MKRKKEAKTLISEVSIFTTMQEVEIIFTDGLPRPETPEEILIRREEESTDVIVDFIDVILTFSTSKPRKRGKRRNKGRK